MKKAIYKPAYIQPTQEGMYRQGKTGRITGVSSYTPPTGEPRIIFHVEYPDGATDEIPVAPTTAYRLLAHNQVALVLNPLTT